MRFLVLLCAGTAWAGTPPTASPTSAPPDQHLKALAFSNKDLNNLLLNLMSAKISLNNDPMVEGYQQFVSGKYFDPENDENTLKGVMNVNTPILIRKPATQAFYLKAMHH